MNNKYFYIFILIFFIFVCIYGYIRIKYGFWYYQPVFHAYNLWWYLFPCGIINHGLPEKNRFTNTTNITFLHLDKTDDSTMDKCTQLLQNNFIKNKENKENKFHPEKHNIVNYFKGHNTTKYPCFLSLYWEKELLQEMNAAGEFIKHDKLVGMMTTRPLYIKFKKDKANLVAYYVDYLCVHKDYRKKGYAPQIIQTHHYHQRHAAPQVHVSLFKRENDLTGIVPFCLYSTYGFSIKGWKKPLEIKTEDKILECSSQNMRYLLEFMKETSGMFDVTITPELSNILELIHSRNIFVYFVLNTATDQVMAAYFFRNSCVSLEKDCKVITCFASICRENYNDEAFAYWFKTALFAIPMMDYLFLAVEDISHNKKIIDNLHKKNKPQLVSPCAYFFYNFVYSRVPCDKIFLLV
jgi:hypothetical protein